MTPEVIFGLRALICIFPAIALGIAILAIYRYPLDGDYLIKVTLTSLNLLLFQLKKMYLRQPGLMM